MGELATRALNEKTCSCFNCANLQPDSEADQRLADSAPAPDPPEVSEEVVNDTVLVIDDDKSILKLIHEILKRRGVKVIVAANGPLGINKFRQNMKEVGLVILDRSMPLMSGEEVLRELREIDPSIPIVLTSGGERSFLEKHCEDLNLAGFLCKPFKMKLLMEQVNQIFNRRTINNPEICLFAK